MDAFLDPIRDVVEGTTDFKGQVLAEDLSTVLLYTSTMLALVVGFVYDDIYLTLWTGLALTVAIMLIVVPPWPVFNRHPQRWLGSSVLPAGGIMIGGKKVQ